ncbi:TetR/AcrR family transcriptional regulator [Rubrobacter aplysinae]|uniref:TetR/AcrR family transcriptional regulator n=1 Tax=Rubrobacter aplysinae TaxID=909625 RepID=UPI001364D149|nr:TetR/AcrR family transcriptional regulator [Rubrobacter aplysinae]
MDAKRGSADTHQKLLDAAERIVLGEGAGRLTLDAVAREAGVSKGGLLYHFPSKERLVAEMVEHLAVERFERELDRRVQRSEGQEKDDGGDGSWVRAYVEATFEPEDEERNLAVQSGLFAAVANDPALLEPLRERYGALQERAENDGVDPALATIVRLASDGLWFLELFDIPGVEGELREEVLTRLRTITDEDPNPAPPDSPNNQA